MRRRRTPNALLVLAGGVAAACLLAMPVHSQGPGNSQGLQIGLHKGREVAAGEVLVKLRQNARQAPMAQELGVDRDELVGDGSIRRIHSRSRDVEALLARLSASGDVEYVEPNYIVYALEVLPPPSDYSESLLWGLKRISAPLAWGITQGVATNVVGVVDTGIDYNHPDLGANVWLAPKPFTVTIGGVSITCPQGSRGFNAIRKTCDPMDDNNHGTHVSGTIGAVGNNGGIVGVNPTTSIMGLKFLNRSGSGTTGDAINAIEFAIQAKAQGVANVRVLSNSWGGGSYSQSLLDEINKANSSRNDMLFVVAAGNSGRNVDDSPYYPASYNASNVVPVAATDSNDALASWSNYGAATVDLAAPGVDIYSTVRGGKYGTMSGTSMATPHVSGAAALVLAKCNGLITSQLKNVLLGTVDGEEDRVTGLVGKVLTGGRLNVGAAVASCGSVPPPPTPPADFSIEAAPTSNATKRGTPASYTVTLTPSNGFSDSVDLAVTGCPAGYTRCGFDIDPVPVGYPEKATSTLTVTPGSSTRTWTYVLKITGTSGGLVHSTTVRLSVTR